MNSLKSIVILVNDQQEALDFYTKQLGFEVNTDASFGEGNRWLTVSLPGQHSIEIVLTAAKSDSAKSLVGKQSDSENAIMGFYTDDIEKDIERFKTSNVRMATDLIEEPYGKFVFFNDLYGNKFYLHQAK